MLHIMGNVNRAILAITLVVAASFALLLAGCGNNSADTSSAPAPPPTTAAPHMSAAGSAINGPLTLSQLQLDSPIKPEKDKNGLTFLHFKYTDNDGKVYMCILPEGQSEGQHTVAEWLATFTIYKQPKVLAQKPTKKAGEGLGDFPFIAPKPQQAAPAQTAAPTRAPVMPMPQLPGGSSMPGGSPMPGPMPPPPPPAAPQGPPP